MPSLLPRLLASAATLLAILPTPVFSDTKTFNFNITWVNANPDGQFDRRTIGINNQWPLPLIEVNKGDRLIVNVENGLGDQPTGLHFHGLFQNGTNYADGPVGVTQCPIEPGQKMTYDFTVCMGVRLFGPLLPIARAMYVSGLKQRQMDDKVLRILEEFR